MSRKLNEFSRRKFLRGAGKIMLPLPILNCMLNSNGTAYAQGAKIKPFFLYAINGLSTGASFSPGAVLLPDNSGYKAFDSRGVNCYYPLKFGKLSTQNISLPLSMSPLNNLKNDFNIITNLEVPVADGNPGAVTPSISTGFFNHIGLYSLLSGSGKFDVRFKEIRDISGQIVRQAYPQRKQNMSTPDHFIHEKLGGNSRLISLHVEKVKHGSGRHRAVSWKNAQDMDPQRNLDLIFNLLFANVTGNGSSATLKNIEKIKKQGILDLVKSEYDEVKKLVGSEDRRTLDSYATNIEELEKDVRAITSVPADPICVKPDEPNINDSVANNYANEVERAKVINTMIAMAASCGISQVMSYGITHTRSGLNASKLKGFVTNPNYKSSYPARDLHGLMYNSHAEGIQAYKESHQWQVSVYADLINKFKNIKVGDSTMLDYSNLIYIIGGGFGKGYDGTSPSPWSVRSFENMVVMNAGGKNLGVKLGSHINGKKRHPMSVVNSAMKSMGIAAPKVGEVSSTINEIS